MNKEQVSRTLIEQNKTNDLDKRLTRQEKFWLLILSLITIIALYYGWKLFWFLTDDAYIAFRYVSNSILGHGYVWNPPPFHPVEGYTSFLWVFLLDIIWRLTGIQPPEAANWMSLIFTYLTLMLAVLMILKMKWTSTLLHYRVLILGLVLLGTLSNRTFLAWSSSGLETAMFNFFFTLWIFTCLYLPYSSNRWLLGISTSASLIYLTRPDGLLIAMATMGLASLTLLEKKLKSQLKPINFLMLTPLLIIPIHLLWRYYTYNEWLPNTYYAKSVPGRYMIDSGIKFLLSFIIEYSLWIWFVLLIIVGIYGLTKRQPISFKYAFAGSQSGGWAAIVPIVVILTIIVQISYYTIIVGGDHFEFRVYSYLILFLFISFAWILNAWQLNIKPFVFVFMCFIFLSWPIPWTHWLASQPLTTRDETAFMKVSVTEAIQNQFSHIPNPLIHYLQFYDSIQFSLIDHTTGMRHQEHKVFHEYVMEIFPDRRNEQRTSTTHVPVQVGGSVGVFSWTNPSISIIDGFGLNDYVIARNPSLNQSQLMAHERQAPEGYIECFSEKLKQTVIVEVPVEKIIECEQFFMSWTRTQDLAPIDIRAHKEPPHLIDVRFGDFFHLKGYELQVDQGIINVTLYWETLKKPDFDYSVFTHLIDESGEILTQNDHSPGNAHGYPPTVWTPGEVILDSHLLEYSDGLEGLSLNIGVYNWSTGERLPICSSEHTLDNYIVLKDLIEVLD